MYDDEGLETFVSVREQSSFHHLWQMTGPCERVELVIACLNESKDSVDSTSSLNLLRSTFAPLLNTDCLKTSDSRDINLFPSSIRIYLSVL